MFILYQANTKYDFKFEYGSYDGVPLGFSSQKSEEEKIKEAMAETEKRIMAQELPKKIEKTKYKTNVIYIIGLFLFIAALTYGILIKNRYKWYDFTIDFVALSSGIILLCSNMLSILFMGRDTTLGKIYCQIPYFDISQEQALLLNNIMKQNYILQSILGLLLISFYISFRFKRKMVANEALPQKQ